MRQQAILHAKEFNISSWLSVLSLKSYDFDLSAQEFRDGLALRYRKPLLCVPSTCDGCGDSFSLTHALDCWVGRLVTQRHNEGKDVFGDLASLVYHHVRCEPVVHEASNANEDTLIADLCVRGVWQPQCDALFDIRVIDTDARS